MIGYAEQRGSDVWAYSENGSYLWTKSGKLMGFTSMTVAVRLGSSTYVYGERGEVKYVR